MKNRAFIWIFSLMVIELTAQLPNPSLIGYWHNWNDSNAPYISLDQVDDRYNTIPVAFAIPQAGTDYHMEFTPDQLSQATFINQVEAQQNLGKKVLISIGGATAQVSLDNISERNSFISTMNDIIQTYGFDGIDIDLEGSSVTVSGGTITSPVDAKIIHLIDAVRQIMSDYYTVNGKKLILTMAPETAFVQGGMAAYGGVWGAYLPVIHALRDSIDMLHVQLYNSGSMLGIDGNIYTQGTADFIIAMTEAVIQGFQTAGGFFYGLPAHKVSVGLPACTNAAGGGYTSPLTVSAAMNYLRGEGLQPGAYVLEQLGGYPDLGGMMTWSVNWDALSTCGTDWEYANNFVKIFDDTPSFSLGFLGSGSELAPDIDRVVIPLDAPHRPVDVGHDFTLEFWMKASPDDNQANECDPSKWYNGNVIIDRDIFGDGDHGDYGIVLCNRVIVAGVQRGDLSHGGVVGNTIVDDGEWHHIAVTRQSATGGVWLYVDGVLDASSASSASDMDISYRDGRSTMYPDDPTLVFGAEKHDYPGSLYYKGKLDEFRLSGSIRYTTNFSPALQAFTPDIHTVALYHFDEGGGNVLYDLSAAAGGPSNGSILYGGNPEGPVWSFETPFQPYREVTNTNDSGSGSLRQLVQDAAPGATIVFSPGLSGQTITLQSPIIIDKKLIIRELNSNPITIEVNGAGPVFNINHTGNLLLRRLKINSGTGLTGRAISNEGHLIMREIELTDLHPGSGNSIFNTGTLQWYNTNILE